MNHDELARHPAHSTPHQPPALSFGYESESITHQHVLNYLHIILKRKWLVLSFFFSTILVAGLYTYSQTPIYRGTVIMQLIQDNPQSFLEKPDPLAGLYGYDTQTKFYETQYMLLKSKPLAARIVDALNLREHPQFSFAEKLAAKGMSKEEIDRILAGIVLNGLNIKPLKKSYLVEVTFDSPDKKLAYQIPNAVYKEYINFSMETRRQSYILIREWLENELLQLVNKVESSEKKIYDNANNKGYLIFDGEKGEENIIVKKYVELNRVLTSAEAERTQKEAQYQQIGQKGDNAAIIANNPLLMKLREDIIAQEAKVSSINKLYGKNYPQLQAEQAKLNELRARLTGEKRRLEGSIKADYEVALRTEKMLRESAENQKDKVVILQSKLAQHNILKRDLQTNEQLFQGLLARMKEANVASTMVASNVAVIDPAVQPIYPSKPRKIRNMLIAALIGLMGGLGLAFVVEYLDNSLKSIDEMERVCRIPSLGVVPFSLSGSQRAISEGSMIREELMLTILHEPKSVLSESVQHVGTSVLLSFSGSPPVVLVITSPNPGEGKSTITTNLAISLASSGNKVLIVDADMRKPTIHRSFEIPQMPGLSNLLSGSASLAEAVNATEVENLYFIAAGNCPPNPVNLLNSQTFKDLMGHLRCDFKYIICDTPPIIGFADGRIISSLADGVLMVFKHHSTSREAARLATQLLGQAQAHIIGGILNMARHEKLGYGGYYGYYKYYNKYYNRYYSHYYGNNDQEKG